MREPATDCYLCQAIEEHFDRKKAAARPHGYQRGGLKRESQVLVNALEEQGVAGYSLLDVAGGMGALAIELIKRGVDRATINRNAEIPRDTTMPPLTEAQIRQGMSLIDRLRTMGGPAGGARSERTVGRGASARTIVYPGRVIAACSPYWHPACRAASHTLHDKPTPIPL